MKYWYNQTMKTFKQIKKEVGHSAIFLLIIFGLGIFLVGIILLAITIIFGEESVTISGNFLSILALMGNGATITAFAVLLRKGYSKQK